MTTVHEMPSPDEKAILSSAKLYALRARLHLPDNFPIQTLARCLVHPTADPDPHFNNASLAILGGDLLGYYTAEWLLCNFPRLPISVLFAAQNAYVGPKACLDIVRKWGVEAVAEPGGEVEPGFLQFRSTLPGVKTGVNVEDITAENAYRHGVKRGMGARIVSDDQFGDFGNYLNRPAKRAVAQTQQSADPWETSPASIPDSEIEEDPASAPVPAPAPPPPPIQDLGSTDHETAATSFFRALTGALHLHTSPTYSSTFHASHVLSRHLDISKLFTFQYPTRDISRLCAREGFHPPIARLLSETGRYSIAPVFVVGVYSGHDKLGEGAGNSLHEARNRAAANALRGWYLYRPGDVVRPSEAETKRWRPNYIDCGEVVQ